MTHQHGFSSRPGVGGSGSPKSPWLGLAATCSAASATTAAILAIVAFVVGGTGAGGSVLFSAVMVIAFFALSLVAGHIAGRNNPSGAIGVFAVVYVVKIVGFAALLLWLGKPAWIVGPWFGAAGIMTVVVWQVVEVLAFSRLRLQIFDDAPAAPPAPDDGTPPSSEDGPRG